MEATYKKLSGSISKKDRNWKNLKQVSLTSDFIECKKSGFLTGMKRVEPHKL